MNQGSLPYSHDAILFPPDASGWLKLMQFNTFKYYKSLLEENRKECSVKQKVEQSYCILIILTNLVLLELLYLHFEMIYL